MCATAAVQAVATPPSTWVPLAPLPGSGHGTIFGIAADPVNASNVIAGDSRGAIYRSVDAGTTWSRAYGGRFPILTIAYDPLLAGTVLAGTRGGGVLVSTDSGAHWKAASGLEGRSVAAVAFARTLMVAGTDKGVYSSTAGASWSATSLNNVAVHAVAVLAVNDPVRIVAGGDSDTGTPRLYSSIDGGATWTAATPQISGTSITHLAAGPLPPGGTTRPLVLGTNTGLFISTDNGSSFTALSGAQLLPSIDYTQAVFSAGHFDRFYVASDGGGGGSGGVWATADSGQHFSSLQPPMPSVTALAISSDDQPVLYVATFRPADQSGLLFAYHDTGGTPQGPFLTPTPSVSASRTGGSAVSLVDDLRALASSQVPYVALGVVALLVILLAAVSHIRSRRR